jgi:hypothetical protein
VANIFRRFFNRFKNEKYVFDPLTLSYEKAVVGWGTRILRLFGFLSASLVFSLAISSIYYSFFSSPKEKVLRNELNIMQDKYKILNQETDRLSAILDELHYRDGNIYRVLFEADPIDDAEWMAGSGGVNKYRELEKYESGELIKDLSMRLDRLKKQMVVQSKSYEQIAELIKNQQQMLSSIPSIQPVKNRDLKHIASGFGYRTDPIYKITKFHAGMDFTAPVGTDVFATGDGTVETVNYSFGGYGNEIVINHGYGYKTRYAHLSRFNVRVGQKVKRGEKIADIGNTGKSTGPHLHYEVLKAGSAVNPVYFYYSDLNDAQFTKVLEMSDNPAQSLD